MEITLFLYEPVDPELVPEGINVMQVTAPSSSLSGLLNHVDSLYEALQKSPVDTVIYWWCHSSALLCSLILLRLMGIAVITSLRFDHNIEILQRGRKYKHRHMLATMRACDKIICLSRSSEIYLRMQGIDSIFIPNAIRKISCPNKSVKRKNIIAFACRLHDAKKGLDDALEIIKLVRHIYPDAKLMIIGRFEKKENEVKFYERVDKLGIRQAIHITGWTDDPSQYFNQCKVFLSTSLLEGFPNSLAEAQACGLPVVMYDLDIDMSIGNTSIISVPQNDINMAALKICEVFAADREWPVMSQEAISTAGKYSLDRLRSSLLYLLNNFLVKSDLHLYSENDYRRVLHYMQDYSDRTYKWR